METNTTDTKSKIDDIFEEIGIPSKLTKPILVASMAVVAIPVIAGVCYLKYRKKVNADTSSAFMNMGNGNF